MKMLSFLLMSMALSAGAQTNLETIYKNNLGVRDFKNEKVMEAYEGYLALLAAEPYNPLLQFNLSSSLYALKEEEKSVGLYKQLLEAVNQKLAASPSPEALQQLATVKFAVLYNLGVSHQAKTEIDQALNFYQQALELNPDSQEIKTNIEMMLNQNGGGKGKDNKDKKDQGEGGGQGDQNKDQDQNQNQDQKNQQNQSPQQSESQKKQQKGKEFDQKQMSMEDLNRIMEELKQQEQNIRAKVQRKGDKSEPQEKTW